MFSSDGTSPIWPVPGGTLGVQVDADLRSEALNFGKAPHPAKTINGVFTIREMSV